MNKMNSVCASDWTADLAIISACTFTHVIGFFTIRKSDVCSNPNWGKCLTKFILFCVTLDLSDNLTEMGIVIAMSQKPTSTMRVTIK